MDLNKHKLKPPGSKRLKLNCDILLSTSPFKFNSRPHSKVTDEVQHLVDVTTQSLNAAIAICGPGVPVRKIGATIHGGGLHASTSQLNVSTLGDTSAERGQQVSIIGGILPSHKGVYPL